MNWIGIKTQGTEKSSKGIANDYEFQNILFISQKIGFFSGLYKDRKKIGDFTLINIYKHQDAIILKTTDGGLQWIEKDLGPGEVIQIEYSQPRLIALKRSYWGEQAENTHSHIYISKDTGDSWEEIGKLEEEIDEIHFWTPLKGIGVCGIYGYKYKKHKILLTLDGGIKWKEIKLPKENIYKNYAISSSGELYYLSSPRNYIVYNLEDQTYKEFFLIKPLLNPFSTVLDNNDQLYIVTSNNEERLILYKMDGDQVSDTIEFPFKGGLIYEVHMYNQSISILVNKGKISAPSVFFYKTEDMGKSWKEEKLPLDYIRNIAFYGEDHIWIRTFPGLMLVRE